MRKVNKVLFACAVAAVNLAACSGGGPSSSPTPTPAPPAPTPSPPSPAPTPTPTPTPAPTPAIPLPPSPSPTPTPVPAPTALEGLYLGTTSNNDYLEVFIGYGDRLFVTYSRPAPPPASGPSTSYGGAQANGTLTGGSYTATDGRDYPLGAATRNGTLLQATFTAATGDFVGTATYGTESLSFVTKKVTDTNVYNYTASFSPAAAVINQFIGTWTGLTQYGPATVTIQTPSCDCEFSGTVTIAPSVSCAFTGKLSAPTIRNALNIDKWEFDSANTQACKTAYPSNMTGVAYTYKPAGSTVTRLVMTAQTSDRANGIGIVVSK